MSQDSEGDTQDLSINAWLPRVTAGLDSDAERAKAMVPYLEDADPYVRQLAVECIAELRMPEYSALLSERLSDTEGFVRASAAEAVDLLDYRPAVPQLVRQLQSDSDDMARICAAEALGDLADASAAVLDALAVAVRHDPNELVRAYAAESLGILGAVDAVGTLKQQLAVEDSTRMEVSILTALILIGDGGALERFILVAVADDSAVGQPMLDRVAEHVPASTVQAAGKRMADAHPDLRDRIAKRFSSEPLGEVEK